MKTPTKMAPDGEQLEGGSRVWDRETCTASSTWSQRHLNTAMLRHSAWGSGSVFVKPFLELSRLQCILWAPTADPTCKAVSHVQGPAPRLITQGEGNRLLCGTGWENIYRELSMAGSGMACQKWELSWALLSEGSREIMWLGVGRKQEEQKKEAGMTIRRERQSGPQW